MADIDQFTDQEIIAKTAWGECRGGGNNGMQGVVNTGFNRIRSGIIWWGQTPREVFLHPFQYSCWNATDPNRPKLFSVTEDDPQYASAMSLATFALAGTLPDIVSMADSYFSNLLPKLPKWAEGLTPVATIGHHQYYVTAHKANPANAFTT